MRQDGLTAGGGGLPMRDLAEPPPPAARTLAALPPPLPA